uniref:Rho-GAP domain-containing protein n=1 Tax=Schistocephalus solidus TaxID=70667 RepID=A0A0V0J4W2_SCHSO
MKQSFLSKFSRSSGSAPTGWPSEDVVEIDASAVEMKKITSDLIKKLVMFLPPAGFSGEGFLETDNLSNGLLSSITGNKSVLSSPSFRSAPWNKSSSSDPVKKRDLSGIPVSQQLIMETSSAEQRKDTDVRRKVKVTSGTSFFVPKTIVNENHASAVDGCIKQAVTLEEDSYPGIAVGSAHGNFKKIPESVLARTCLESSERLSNLQPTLSHLFFGCGQAASQMACARLNWGNRVQSSVVAPLRRIVEATAPNGELVKSRRQAWRAGGELRSVSERAARAVAASTSCVGSSSAIDSSDELSPLVQSLSSPPLEATVYEHCKGSSRLQSSAKNSQIEKSLSDLSASSKSLITPLRSPTTVKSSLNCARPVTGTYIAGNGGSTSNIRDEDRSQKVLIRTAKATQLNAIKQDLEVEAQLMKEKALHELYNFESMSILECGKALVDLVEISASYHRTCVAILEELSPMLKEELDEQCPLPVFGRQLETHLQATGRRIAYPIKVCVRALNKPRVLAEEGLFRIAGSKKKVDTLQSALNTLRAENIIDQYDSFVIADVLKQYLRRLPEPLLTRKLFTEWTAVQHISGAHLQVAHLCQTASKLPEASRVNAGYLFRFLQELAKYADKNRMTATNLGIILGPTLLAPPITVDDELKGDHESPKVNSIASKNHQNLTHHKSASPDTTLTKSNNVSESFTCAGSRGGVIELLITYADEVFPELIDDDSFELENEISENGDIFGDSETQLPAGVSESTCSKDSQNTEGRQYTPRLIPTTKLGRRAQRCRNELTRQGRSLPQRLKVKHSTSTSSTPRSLHTLQVFFYWATAIYAEPVFHCVTRAAVRYKKPTVSAIRTQYGFISPIPHTSFECFRKVKECADKSHWQC